LLGQVQPLFERIGGWRPDRLTSVAYYDRYLKSPLSLRLALEFLTSLVRSGRNGKSIPIKLVSEPYRPDSRFADKLPWQVHHDWRSDDDRGRVTEEMAARLGLDATVELKRDRHARQLDLVFDDGSISTLLLDQGFGSWSAPTGIAIRFDFNALPEEQAIKLQKLNLMLEGPRSPSYIVAHCSTSDRD
jgi:DEAD/DEAH box helicase domain-containing protein